MEGQDNIKTFVKEELKRLQSSMNRVLQKSLKEGYGKLEYDEYCRLNDVATLFSVSLRLLGKFDLAPRLFKVARASRPKYDVAEGSLRSTLHRVMKGSLMDTLLTTFKWSAKGIYKPIAESAAKNLKLLGLFKEVMKNADVFLAANDLGAQILSRWTGEKIEDCYDDERVLLFTIFSAFKDDESFKMFLSEHRQFVHQAFEVIITDPIKIYLRLTKEDFIIIVDSITMKSPLETFNNTDLVDILLELQEDLKKSYEDDKGFHKQTTEFFKAVADKYIKDFQDEYTDLREQLDTRERQEKFLQSFETGALFMGRK